jgi:hypothetical protein
MQYLKFQNGYTFKIYYQPLIATKSTHTISTFIVSQVKRGTITNIVEGEGGSFTKTIAPILTEINIAH